LTEKLQKALEGIKELEEMKKVLARLESMEVERARQPKNLPLIAIGSFFWATSMINADMNYRSPLSKDPPIHGPSLGQPLAQKVIIILIDALRYDTAQNESIMPTINALREIGRLEAKLEVKPPVVTASARRAPGDLSR
jgi:hypothetical protein